MLTARIVFGQLTSHERKNSFFFFSFFFPCLLGVALEMKNLHVGFIGLGLMGGPMAQNIARAGFSLTVATRTPGKAESFAAQHACSSAPSPGALAASCRVVVLCVTDSPDVEKVARGPEGVLARAAPGTVVVDMSTISPEVTRELAAAASERGVFWLDAPVSGGTKGAAEGTLTIMVGGEEAALKVARPVLEAMGKKITHFGGPGQGQNAKLCNQIMTGVNLLGVCEALTFAQKAGLDLAAVHSALTGGAANSWALDVLGKRIVDDDYKPTFMVKLQQKDLRLVLQAASQTGVVLPAAALSNQMLTTVEAEGRGDDGTQSLVRTYRKMAGLPETTEHLKK